jgi:hypothetical protein
MKAYYFIGFETMGYCYVFREAECTMGCENLL